jgi:hypothetical protein
MDRRISFPKPEFTPEETRQLHQAFLDRVQCKFEAAVTGFTGLLQNESPDDYRKLWLTS